MRTTIKTNNPDLRGIFLNTLSDMFKNPQSQRTGKLLVSVGEMKEEGNEYVFEVEYV